MAGKRRQFTAEFKSRVALAAIKGEKTVAQLATEFEVAPGQITQWKKQLLEALPEVFGKRRERSDKDQEDLTDRLYREIGKLKIEKDFLEKKSRDSGLI